jgi:multiple sugar transport system permease protein
LRKSQNKLDIGIISVFLTWSLIPILWLLGTSLKSELYVDTIPPHWIPNFDLTAYKKILENDAIQKTLTNSLIIAIGSTLLAIFCGSLAGFALGQLVTKRHIEFEFWILSSRLAPPIAIILPLFIGFQYFNLQDTLLALILAHAVMLIGLVTWILIETFRAIPKDIKDACEVDGCTEWQMFIKIMFPLARSSIIGIASLSFLLSWNEFFLSLVLSSSNSLTVQVLLYQSIGYQTFSLSQLAATSIIVLLPTLIVVSVFQKQLIQGLTFGSVKG